MLSAVCFVNSPPLSHAQSIADTCGTPMRRQGERVDVTYILFSSGTFGLTFNTTQRGSCLIVKLDPKIITQSDRLPLKFPVGFWKEEICVFLFLFCLSVQVCLRVCHKPVFSVIDTTESVSRTTLQGSNIVARLLRKKKEVTHHYSVSACFSGL